MVADAIAARGPACWASGRCCRFEQFGHRLYVTGLEAALTVVRLELGGGLAWAGANGPLDVAQVDAAATAGGCPFQSANLCGVHTIKPVACRVFFCDRTAQTWQSELLERAHGMIRELHDRHAIGYAYAEWRWLLRTLLLARRRG